MNEREMAESHLQQTRLRSAVSQNNSAAATAVRVRQCTVCVLRRLVLVYIANVLSGCIYFPNYNFYFRESISSRRGSLHSYLMVVR